MTKLSKTALQNISRFAYWGLPIILVLAQLIYTLQSTHQIRFEELSESVRNPFWLFHKTIFDGLSSNFGWYFPLLAFYQIFGFSLNAAKWLRVGLQTLSLFSLAALLKNWLGMKRAWLPLLIIGLSPTWLYFNTLQAQFAIDLQYISICLYLLFSLDFSKKYLTRIKTFLLWSLSMIAATSYPNFLFYLPFLSLIYLDKLKQTKKSASFWLTQITFSAVSFFLPLVLGFLYITNRHLLINDSRELNSGLFRGGGRWPPLERLPSTIYLGIKRTLIDLFIEGRSYYFEVLRVEFSHPLTAVAVIGIVLVSLWLFKSKRWRNFNLLIWFLLLSSLIVGNLSDWTQGIRRNTPALAAFYLLFCLTWYVATKKKRVFPRILQVTVIISGVILLFHHLKVYRDNYLVTLPLKSPNRESACFNLIPNSPTKSLKLLVDRAKTTGKLEFTDTQNKPIDCRLVEVYAAVSASCYFNKLNCPPLTWFYPKKKTNIPLSNKLWNDYYFSH